MRKARGIAANLTQNFATEPRGLFQAGHYREPDITSAGKASSMRSMLRESKTTPWINVLFAGAARVEKSPRSLSLPAHCGGRMDESSPATDDRLLKRHQRQVSRAKERVRLSEPDLRTPDQLRAAREASRPAGGWRNAGHALYIKRSTGTHAGPAPDSTVKGDD